MSCSCGAAYERTLDIWYLWTASTGDRFATTLSWSDKRVELLHVGTGPDVVFDRRARKFIEHRVSCGLPRFVESAEIEFGAWNASLDTTLFFDATFDCLDHVEDADVCEFGHEAISAAWTGCGLDPSGLDEWSDHLREIVRRDVKFRSQILASDKLHVRVRNAPQ